MAESSKTLAMPAKKRNSVAAALETGAEAVDEQPKRRKLARRVTEDQVERTISESFSNFSSKQLRVDLVDNKTMTQHLYDMKREARARKGKVSAKALEALGQRFGGPDLTSGGLN